MYCCFIDYSVLNVERGVEEIQADEAVDCQVMELLRDEVLPHSQHIPHQFILRVVMLLNKGSIHSATTTNIGKLLFFSTQHRKGFIYNATFYLLL